MSAPWPMPESTVKLVQPWRQMSRDVRYAIVVCCEQIVFVDGSVARQLPWNNGVWGLVSDNDRQEVSEAFAFAFLTSQAVPTWTPSPALVAQAMAELRKRRTA